jgi:PadR family transcriptional regulator PadR
VVRSKKEQELLLGTLDMLILQTLVLGAAHGHTIAHVIEHRSEDVLQIEQGSLYPALHRLEDRGWVSSYWGVSENNRKARFYRLTAAGRRQLTVEADRWQAMVEAIGRVMENVTRPAEQE